MKYKICSFSGDEEKRKGFNNPAVWGHYANSFKGVAVEVKIKDGNYGKYFQIMDYNDCDFILNNVNIDEIKMDDKVIKKILRYKKRAWEYEDEYRLLVTESDKLIGTENLILEKDDDKNIYFAKIDEITAIYFGDPYGNIQNKKKVRSVRALGSSKKFQEYKNLKEKIIKIAENQKIGCFNVKIENGIVKKTDKNLWN